MTLIDFTKEYIDELPIQNEKVVAESVVIKNNKKRYES